MYEINSADFDDDALMKRIWAKKKTPIGAALNVFEGVNIRKGFYSKSPKILLKIGLSTWNLFLYILIDFPNIKTE